MGYQVSSEATSVDDRQPACDSVETSPQEASVATSRPQQEEMPFAVVQGKELTVLPKALYIPPDSLEVIL